ncbi:MAG TPA: hypothetical protein VE465_13530 [Streptosporangiaceae bacterium]|jgi:hypothetical protein|nr:hypothetical protein [Streptosporangiaceae bacterium]
MPEGFERVHVEHEWYDGPRAGLADVGGVVHYFQAVPDSYRSEEFDDKFLVWPAGAGAFALEREQWAIFVAWNSRYEAGMASVDSHPGTGGVDPRYDELESLLAAHRVVPGDAMPLVAEWRPVDRQERYHVAGPDYLVKWHADH